MFPLNQDLLLSSFQKWLIVWKLWLLSTILPPHKNLILVKNKKVSQAAFMYCLLISLLPGLGGCICKIFSEKCQTHKVFLILWLLFLNKSFSTWLGKFLYGDKDNRFRKMKYIQVRVTRGTEKFLPTLWPCLCILEILSRIMIPSLLVIVGTSCCNVWLLRDSGLHQSEPVSITSPVTTWCQPPLLGPQDVPLSTKRVCLDRDDHSLDKIPIEPPSTSCNLSRTPNSFNGDDAGGHLH